MKTLKILFVDDQDIRDDLFEYFNESQILGINVIAEVAATFAEGIEKIKERYYDIAVLDLCDGEPSENADKDGLKVLKEIQQCAFIPVIFYTGIAHTIDDLKSEIVDVIDKKAGVKALEASISNILSSNIGLLKSKILSHINEELKKYFWEIIDKEKNIFQAKKNDYSLGYLMLRRLSHSLSKQNIKNILGDELISNEKIHPMEFYIYPTTSLEYEAGEIIVIENNLYVLLTPSCDYVERVKKGISERKVGKVLLGRIFKLEDFPQYKAYKANGNAENTNKLKSLITNISDRYFFLPKTPFIDNSVIDFQNKIMLDYENLTNYKRLAKLDDPFAQSMASSFIRYYNRVGFPDIDPDYIIATI